MLKFLFVSAILSALTYFILFAPVMLGLKVAGIALVACVGRWSA